MEPPKGFEKPNHTQTPNTFFDESLKHISSLPELKVVLAVIRKTLGWQKERDKISMSQIRTLTGMKQQSVQRGIDLALTHCFIEREPAGQQFFYSLKLVTPCDQSQEVTSHTTLPKPVTRRDRKLVTPCDTQKKEKEKKEINPSFARLMNKHAKRIGHVSDVAAQGAALKWLVPRYTESQLIECYRSQLRETWRKGRVSWLTVRKDIALWVTANNGGNGRAVAATMADIQQMKEAQ